MISTQTKTVECTIVQTAFQYIHVAGIAGERRHTLIPKDHANTSACFAVSIFIRQIVINSESFIAPGGSDPSGYIEVAPNYIFPHEIHSFLITCIAGHRTDIRSPRIQIHRTNRMTGYLLLVFNRYGILRISRIIPLVPNLAFPISMSALIQKILGQLDVPLFSGGFG